MPKTKLSPKTVLLLEHMEAVRDTVRALASDDFTRDIFDLLGRVEQGLVDIDPEPRLNERKGALYFKIDPDWRVNRNDFIQVCVSVQSILHPTEDDDPYVGLYVPAQWPKRQALTGELQHLVPNGFEHIRGRPEYDETVPIWRYIRVRDHINRGKFNDETFVAEMLRAANALLKSKPKIDAAIRRVRVPASKKTS